MEIILDAFFQLILVFPGAFLRWILGGGRKNFGACLETSYERNVSLSVAVLLLLYLLIFE